MKRCLILMLILAVAGAVVLPAAGADVCPIPKIQMMPATVTTDEIPDWMGEYLNDEYSIRLRNANPGVSILSARDVGAVLAYENGLELLGEDAAAAEVHAGIPGSINAEYLVTQTIGKVGSQYVVDTAVIDIDLGIRIASDNRQTTTVEGLTGAVDEQVAALGDLATLIEAHEAAHPVPPRAPSLAVTIEPDAVTPESGRDTTTITVTVKNCRGEVVPDAVVYVEPYPARGRVTAAGGESEAPGHWGWQVATTGDDGTARATYHLDLSKGTGAGQDTVDIITGGRGQKDVHATVTVPINGVALEVRPVKDVIGPKQSTDIYISLVELSSSGERTPLGGKVLLIDESRLPNDAGVVVMGPTDPGGNPITAADGTAVLKFVAGEEERLHRIRVLYTDTGALGDGGSPVPVEAWAEIDVKADAYVATVNWKESGALDYEYHWQYDLYQWDYDYDFTLFTETQKEKNTGEEVTDGTFSYNSDLSYYTEGRTWFDTPFGIGYAIIPFEEEWDINANVKGTISDHESINAALEERMSTLFIPVTPFPIPFDVSGNTRYEGSITYTLPGENELTDSGSGRIENTQAVQVLGSGPQTGIMGDTIAMVTREDPDFGIVMMLKRMSAAIDTKMEVRDLQTTGLLTKAGENVYAKRWSVRESNSYHGDLFEWLGSTARMDMDTEMTREVTLGAVKQ